jgi:DNA repair protein RecO (recombination protein O)
VRINQEPGFVLHQYSYRESSLIFEIFTENYGRISALAKGARRPPKKSGRTYIHPFQEYRFSWSGNGDLATLIAAEEMLPTYHLAGNAAYCGFYVNELTMRMMHKHDPHENLYTAYRDCMRRLASGLDLESGLRLFEKYLLLETGYALNLEHEEGTTNPVRPEAYYRYLPERGPVPVAAAEESSPYITVQGRTLIAYNNEQLENPVVLGEVKKLMRNVIDHMLGFKPLTSRKMFTPNRPQKQ